MFSLPPNIRGLVFDCDGTIVDTMPQHYLAWVEMLGEYGHELDEQLLYSFAGVPTTTIIEILNDRYGYHVHPVQQAADRKESLFVRLIPQCKAIPAVTRIIHQYTGKLPMAVATGGNRLLCCKTLEAVDLLQHFPVLVTCDDVKHGKPAPDIFLEAARRIGVQPEHCCAFEDGDMGIQAARAAGMMVVDVRKFAQPVAV